MFTPDDGQVVHPISLENLHTVTRSWHPTQYAATASQAMAASFPRATGLPPVTVLALAEGLGPGWSAREAHELALQALRDSFDKASEETIGEILRRGLESANRAVYARALEYGAVTEIGCRILVAVTAGDRWSSLSIGGGAIFLKEREGGLRHLTPTWVATEVGLVGCLQQLTLKAAGDEQGVRLVEGDRLILMNQALFLSLASMGDEVGHALGIPMLENAADKLLELGWADPGPELVALLAQVRGTGPPAGASVPCRGRAAFLVWLTLILVVLFIWSLRGWFVRRNGVSTAQSTPVPTNTIYLPPAPTDLPWLPTPHRSPTPTTTRAPLPTPTPTLTPSQTPVPPTTTATPSITPSQPPTPSPTVPVGPIVVGGKVVVVGTEGRGLNVRGEVGLDAALLFSVLDGDWLDVVGGPQVEDDYTWWRLRARDGREGWCIAVNLQGVAPP